MHCLVMPFFELVMKGQREDRILMIEKSLEANFVKNKAKYA
jgi:hypothetical protein